MYATGCCGAWPPPPAIVLALLALGAVGCASSSITVDVCGTGGSAIDSVRLSVLDEGRDTIAQGLTILEDEAGRPVDLPIRTQLSTAPQARWLRAQGLASAVEEIVFERRLLNPEPLDAVRVRLDEACVGVRCEVGQTCLEGICDLAPVRDSQISCTGGDR